MWCFGERFRYSRVGQCCLLSGPESSCSGSPYSDWLDGHRLILQNKITLLGLVISCTRLLDWSNRGWRPSAVAKMQDVIGAP